MFRDILHQQPLPAMPTPNEQSASESSPDPEATRAERISSQGVARDERIVARVPMWAWEEVGELPPYQPGYKPLSPADATSELLELTHELIPVEVLEERLEEWASFAAELDLHREVEYWASKREAIELLTQAGWILDPIKSYFGDQRARAGTQHVMELLDEMTRFQVVAVNEMRWLAPTPPSPTAEATTPKQDGREAEMTAAVKMCSALREYDKQNGPVDLADDPVFGSLGGLHEWAGAIINVGATRAYEILRNVGAIRPGQKGQTRDKLDERFKEMIRYAEVSEALKFEN